MQFFILVIIICLFVFLYCVYLLAHDDFIFLRRDVTMERLFNIIFLGALVDLFFARLFYGLFDGKFIFSNPFVFLLFPYYPGLSLVGGVLGISAFIGFLAVRKKSTLPIGRMADFFSIAFLITLPVGFLGYFMFSEENISAMKAGSQAILYFVLFVIFLKFFLPRLLNGKFKEGTIALLFLVSFSVVNLISNAFVKVSILNYFNYFKNLENIFLLLVLLFSLAFMIRQENLSSTFLKPRSLLRGFGGFFFCVGSIPRRKKVLDLLSKLKDRRKK